jgi:G-patch domain
MDSYGDTDDHDDHDDDSGPIISHSIYRSSSDDEDQQEQLMDDNDDGDDDDDVDIGFRSHHRHGWKGKQRFQQRNKRKNEAIYGVFYESKNTASSSTTMNVAPVFVQAKRKKKKEFGLDNVRDSDDKESNIKNLPSFVAAKSSDSDNMKSIQRAEEKDQVDDTETVLQAKQEQEQADQYFWSLLNKARENNHQRIRKRSTSSSSKNEEEISNTSRSINGPNNSNNRYLDVFTAASSTNLETMLPTSFGTTLGNQPSIGIRTNTVMPITKKDPSMAKWEQHTKGIGSKLLAKMGWTGSGGLGSDNRRRLKTTLLPDDNNTTATSSGAKLAAAPPPNTSTSTQISEPNIVNSKQPRKGISRPVEVVVRPPKLGLGFGNFKEATQFKSNRQLEAEVRGIDLEEQEAQRRKKKLLRRKGGDFTKDFDDDDVSNDEDADFTGRAHFNSAMSYHITTNSLLANQKMETILEIIEKVKDAVGGFTHRQLVQDLVGQLEQQLSPQDQDVLRFWTVLAPTLLRPAIEFTIEGWNPLDATEYGFAASKSMIDSFFFDEWSQINSSSQKVGS